MTFSFFPEAEAEFLEAVGFLEQREEGLGLAFSREIFATVHRIILNPEAWPPYTRGTRRCLANKFPYGIVYRIEGDQIIIWAVAHLSREPAYWSDRLN